MQSSTRFKRPNLESKRNGQEQAFRQAIFAGLKDLPSKIS
jgi:hypothetical protein